VKTLEHAALPPEEQMGLQFVSRTSLKFWGEFRATGSGDDSTEALLIKSIDSFFLPSSFTDPKTFGNASFFQ